MKKSFLTPLLLFVLFQIAISAESQLHRIPSTGPNGADPTAMALSLKIHLGPPRLTGKSLTQSWQAELGKGYPGPVLSEELVFTIESVEGSEVVHALDRKTGETRLEIRMGGSNESPLLRRQKWELGTIHPGL